MNAKKIESVLVKEIARLLNIKQEVLSLNQPFKEMGLNVKLCNALIEVFDKQYNIRINILKFYEYPTIQQLAFYLAKNSAIDAMKKQSQPKSPNGGVVAKKFGIFRIKKQGKKFDVHNPEDKGLDVAIIGISCRFPGAANVEEFWKNLSEGIDCIEEVSKDIWGNYSWYNSNHHNEGTSYSKWAGFVKDRDKFDTLFFGISPREAEIMDPQQRLFLEESWKALEDAGCNLATLERKEVGVFVGVGAGDYLHLLQQHKEDKVGAAFMGNSQAILASRIAYFLDITGPAVAIDTACSSSLVAIDRACQSILLGECEMALAGGVYLMNTPKDQIWSSQVGMSSKTGRCRTFDDAADGIAIGEGVGVIILKKLRDAEKDGDRIYGVIKGSGINQDGKTNGITAPNSHSQQKLELGIYEKYSIDPSTVSYVEAHGTGTKLGDPIEINALTASFNKYTNTKQYCALGSVKTNIGHTAYSAGVVGVIKTLLMMKHKKYVPILHYNKINSEIDINDSPFYVNTELKDWVTEGNQPRRAAVSSFGFSGTNAHMVIEEYQPKDKTPYSSTSPAIVLLSAKNKDRLKEQVLNLQHHLSTYQPINLYDIAYTLQIGREAMEERLGFIVYTVDQLKEKLKDYLSGKEEKEQLKLAKEFSENNLIEQIIEKKEYDRLLSLWFAGLSIDWSLLYPENKPNKISLPTYPFARERYWVPTPEQQTATYSNSQLHPLLHINESDLNEQKYGSVFTGEEIFLIDHQIREEKVLPGVAYLEMARAAGELSTHRQVAQLKNIIWLNPIKLKDNHQKIEISLFPSGKKIDYEVHSRKEQEKTIHSQGSIYVGEIEHPEKLDIEKLKLQCKKEILKKEIYEAFKSEGLNLGLTYQGVEKLYISESFALSKINLSSLKEFKYSPGILDSTLHTFYGVLISQNQAYSLALPYCVKEVNFYKNLENVSELWAYARKNVDNKLENNLISYDIDLLNEKGEVLVSFIDFILVSTNGLFNTQSDKLIKAQSNTYLYNSVWKEKPIDITDKHNLITTQQFIFLSGGSIDIADHLKKALQLEVEFINADNTESYFNTILEKVKIRLQEKIPTHIIIVCKNDEYVDYGFITGLLKTAAQENTKVTGKVIGVDHLSITHVEELTSIIETEQHTPDAEVRYINGKREIKTLQSLTISNNTDDEIKIKERGVYLITGGAGGLGQLFATYISKTKNTHLILTGRSELTPEKKELISKIPNAVYYKCDVSIKEEVRTLIKTIKTKYQKLDGIIHSAGVIKDSFIIKKVSEEISQVLSPKIQGAKNLDEATKDEALDFMIFFSSIAGIMGNIGQADYSSANVYLDNYAEYRNELKSKGKRYGKTISINWPLWEDGGMQVDEESKKYLEKHWGMSALPTTEGIKAFEFLLNETATQGVVAYGKQDSIVKSLITPSSQHSNGSNSILLNVDRTVLEKKVENKIVELAAQLLKLNISDIATNKKLGDYGFDSILLTKFSNNLNEYYNVDLMPTVFYNYPTVNELVKFLIEEYGENLIKQKENITKEQIVTVDTVVEKLHSAQSILQKRSRFLSVQNQEPTSLPAYIQSITEPIAIVGISGRFPGSPDINTFWENLQANKDLITEIPLERWDWKKYYGDPQKDKNKTKSKWGGFIEDMDKFDPLFFNISPLEAELMDPQQRITLEAVYHALEDAGISTDSIKSSNTGVFIGVSGSDYLMMLNNQTNLASQAQFSTGSAHSILVNRISYLLDLHGPSEPIDTACSSSLIAIHRAVENIRNGHCDMAIAGGVNALLSPEFTLSFSQAGMLSEDGRCKTFDQSANGYVRGEGVGIVILKALSKAEQDGDHIYGIIRGTTENHGGKANTLTSPNPQAQKELLLKAYRSAGVDPRNVSYIEAHGTGTALGDPIETEGLKLAFAALYKERNLPEAEKPYCSIGSVKANVGHLEAAAGIAGVIKILLSIQHQTLPGNPHLRTPNEYLKLDSTPFYLQKETTAWTTENDKPRIAGISSFGFGGAYAHVVIEEYPLQHKTPYSSTLPAIIILSAKNVDQLREQASNLTSYLSTHQHINLYDIAYTLQIGREAMEERLAVVVKDKEELTTQLENFLEEKINNFLVGNIKKNKSDFLLEGEAGRAYVETAIKNKEIKSLAQLWIKGVDIDWNLLYLNQKPNKISLPVYPFARERYWIPIEEQQSTRNGISKLHPLLHSNESSLAEQKYNSVFSGQETFLVDHKVREEKVLPGVAYLELARAAGELSLEKKITQLKDITWLSPIRVNSIPQKVWINLYPTQTEEVIYEVYSKNLDEQRIHSQGKLSTVLQQAPQPQDILTIQNRLQHSKGKEQCYKLFKEIGLHYGTSFQGIEILYYNEEEALSKISLPQQSDYILNLGILDSALQTCIALSFMKEEKDLQLPFSVREVNIYKPLPETLWCYARKSKHHKAESKIINYDIDLLNEQGEVLLNFKDFVNLPINGFSRVEQVSEERVDTHLLYRPSEEESIFSAELHTEEQINLKSHAVHYIKTLIAKELKLVEHKIELETPFEKYGIDSILINKLTNRLEEVFGNLPRTLFFEYQNLDALIDYFIEEHADRLEALTDKGSKTFTNNNSTTIHRPISTTSKPKEHFIKPQIRELYQPTRSTNNIDIAIIGLSGRYPEAKNVNEFWNNLKQGKDSITEIPKDRWDIANFYDTGKGKSGKSYSKWGGFIEDVDKFDPLFFNISPREAENMDPQERLFLQTVWEAIEDAGYTRTELQRENRIGKTELGGKVGVYAGVMYEEYQLYGAEETLKGNPITLAGSPSSIANRVSYFFNFHGPSMAVDTMCSSSLTAIHLACESIQNGNCALAIAGGVNVSIHPNKYLMLSQGKFVSSKGRCESFGEGGEGYVPSEGVGAILLKPLHKAEADGDQIYGVIKGTSLNHGGKTNGYTVPNPNAQATVIKEALQKANVQAADISYIEAHGTGTSLGDPIEIAGLNKAFQSNKKQYCSIGSVKSNIGHGESAAGIAGLTKVLLQLKHKQIVPSLHSNILNPHIDFDNSSFKVQQELAEWKSENNKPRIAGISSFGAGGSNAHIIIEEYQPKHKTPYNSTSPAIILLSAKNETRLKEQIINLQHYLSTHSLFNLYDIAYTLQVGRESMEERLALVVKDKEELTTQLENFLEGKISNLLSGNIKKNKSDFLLEGGAGQAYINYAIENKESKSLAQLWVKGVSIDWNLLYPENKPNKISLPTYPFARERYWVSTSEKQLALNGIHRLHPLLHSNESNLSEQKYSSVFNGEESFLSDHKVADEKVLPGVAYLELARVAGELSLEKKVTQLKDIRWLSPIKVNSVSQKIHIGLYPTQAGEVEYEVYKQDADKDHIYSQGKLSTVIQQAPPKQDIATIKKLLKSSKEKNECYALFKKIGLDYGISFQGIETLYYNGEEALSKISLPAQQDYILNPGILDSALQTCLGLSFDKLNRGLALPFSVREVNIYQPLSASLWCYVRKNKHHKADSKIINYDIDLLNEQGEALLSFRDFVTLPVNTFSKANQQSVAEERADLHLYNSIWQEALLATEVNVQTATSQLILLAGGTAELADKLKELLEIEVEAIKEEQEERYYLEIFRTIKEKLQYKASSNIIVIYKNDEYLQHSFITGVLKTAHLENPKIIGKTIGVENLSIVHTEELKHIIETEQHTPDAEVRYINGRREIKVLQSLTISNNTDDEIKIEEEGVYLITGGAGELGKIFADYISKIPNTHLILTGRSELTEEKKETIAPIPNAVYYRCDVSNKEEVETLIKTIKAKYQKLDGIIHSAGVIKDSFIIKKTAKEINQVLSPKIQGVKNLDEATKDEALDFIIYFSSVVAIMGNVGQCDYASANAYLDNYAFYRNELKLKGQRQGKTLSINWPLWKEGGMQIDIESEKYLAKQWGMLPLPTEEGIQAFEFLLSKTFTQGVVVYGKGEKIASKLLHKDKKLQDINGTEKEKIAKTTIEKILIEICSTQLKLNAVDIEVDVDFSEYGVDSIIMMKMLDALESRFQIAIEPTAIASYPTISLLADYLQKEKSFSLNETTISTNSINYADSNPILDNQKRVVRNRFLPASKQHKKIAIIGMSCKLPESDSLQEYWNNLQSAKDLISEIPKDRWDASTYYSTESAPDKTYTNKGGFVKNAALFDSLYFKITDEDALCMDPQQRIILELTRELLAHAGYEKEELAGTKTGLYIGAKDNNYVRNNYHLLPSAACQHTIVNNISNMIAARVSDFYNLKGTSQVIDTACSSSLVAIHQACEDILHGKTTMAIAGGISIMVDAFTHIGFSQAEVLSKEGKSYVFDERANGFVMGEGGGLVLLKDYDQAVADGDQIFGIILGSAVNNDGHTMGLTVPNKEGQKEVIAETLQKVNITPEEITYYEAHGTGTLLGDPIEVKAATEVYRTKTNKKQYCAIGSVKSNVGHTMTAAGVTGLIKILLQMQHNQLVPTLHCENPHPRFKFEDSPFYPNTTLKNWDNEKKIAAISSFGFGGTNCHMIVEKPMFDHTSSKRTFLPVQRLSNNYYWLGQAVVIDEQESLNTATHQESTILKEEIYKYDEPYLKDHLVNNEQVLLGVTYAALSIDALQQRQLGIGLEGLLFKDLVILKAGEKTKIEIHLTAEDTIKAYSQKSDNHKFIEVATAKIIKDALTTTAHLSPTIKNIQQHAEQILDKKTIYRKEQASAIVHGKSLQVIDKIYIKKDECVGELSIPSTENTHSYTHVNPALLNGGLLTALSLINNVEGTFIPLMIKRLNVYGVVGNTCLCYGRIVKVNREILEVDYHLCSTTGEILLEVKGFVCKRISATEKQVNDASNYEQYDKALETSTLSTNNVDKEALIISTERFIREQLVTTSIKDITQVSSERNFMDMGVDSTQLISLVKQLENKLGVELYPTLFFEYQNIKDLSAYLAETYSDKFKTEQSAQGIAEQEEDYKINSTPSINASTSIQKEIKPLTFGQSIIQPSKSMSLDKETIAIVGMHGVFPEANNVEQFWQHIYNKKDLIKEIPIDHFDYKPWFNADPSIADTMYCKWGSFIEDVDKFDADFFKISPREAEMMDPQLRHLLQVLYGTVEDAGSMHTIKGSNTGVYVGVCFHDYAQEMARLGLCVNAHEGIGNAATMLANRPSFYFNLTGPSMAIDTACSSSLVALHTAAKAIQNKECDQALVAGVNLLLSSWHYRYFCSIGALSTTGRSHSFDSRADGYVPGESIAAVMLKPIHKAEADGDHIYGIIKGSAATHGGYTLSITAPSVDGEVNVLLKAWEDANIDPSTLGYIEAHGTGTKLGDAVEVNALKKAFKQSTNKTHFCAIGSAKAHIGHTEGAAGMVSVIKVLLSLQHNTIPAMPQFEKINPYIQLEHTPFYINTAPTKWERKNDVPLRAGISGFGFGGTYAHVVIEEYQPKPKIAYSSTSPAIIVLSAKSVDRLKEQAINLKQYLSTHPHINLYDIAYTLQIGREAMEERLALAARDKEELVTQLKDFSEGKIGNFFIGNIKKNKADFIFKGKEYTEVAIKNKDMVSIAQLWIKGAEIDWNLLYPNQKPNKISLPTYPFARERYWIPTPTEQTTMRSENKLHPLLHSNESDLSEQKYSSVFTGKESFLIDHRVGEEKLLPGVAYLELAREAGFRSIHQPITQLKDVSWLSPIRVNDNAQKIQISLHPSGEAIAYEIYSVQGEEVQIHSQGKLSTITQLIPPQQNIAAIQSRLHQNKNKEQCYTLFKDMGLHYGTSFQGIEVLYYNEEEALSKISLPKAKEYILQPGILDSALQTCIGLSFNKSNQTLSLPFSVQEVNIYQHLPENIWCYARKSNHNKIGSKIIHYDIDVLNDQGEVLFNFKDFITLSINGFSKITSDEPLAEEQPSTYLYSTTWQENLLTESSLQTITPTSQLILLAGGSADLADKLKEVLVTEVEVIQADNEENYYLEVFEKTKEKLQQKTPTNITVVYPNEDYIEYSFISGLLKTAHIENPKITGKVVGIDHLCIQHLETIKHIMETEQNTTDTEVRYTNGKREIKNLQSSTFKQ